eukprot:1177015-Prorocentrum_minimum.AAC.3
MSQKSAHSFTCMPTVEPTRGSVHWGVECTLAVIGTGGPVKGSRIRGGLYTIWRDFFLRQSRTTAGVNLGGFGGWRLQTAQYICLRWCPAPPWRQCLRTPGLRRRSHFRFSNPPRVRSIPIPPIYPLYTPPNRVQTPYIPLRGGRVCTRPAGGAGVTSASATRRGYAQSLYPLYPPPQSTPSIVDIPSVPLQMSLTCGVAL